MSENVKYMNNAEFLPHVIALANEGHDVTIPLRGFSMRPFLEDGRDLAILCKIDRPLKVGDIVLAELSPGRYALHRIYRLNKTHVQMLGDGNLSPDPVIRHEDVKVFVKAFLRKGSKKPDYVDGKKFQRYSKIWMKLTPVRRWLLAIWRRLPLGLRNRLL